MFELPSVLRAAASNRVCAVLVTAGLRLVYPGMTSWSRVHHVILGPPGQPCNASAHSINPQHCRLNSLTIGATFTNPVGKTNLASTSKQHVPGQWISMRIGASCIRFSTTRQMVHDYLAAASTVSATRASVPLSSSSMARGGMLRLGDCLVVALAAWARSTADAASSPHAHIGMQTSGRQLLQGKSTNCSSASHSSSAAALEIVPNASCILQHGSLMYFVVQLAALRKYARCYKYG